MQRSLSPANYPSLQLPPSLQSLSRTLPAVHASLTERPRDVDMSLPPEAVYSTRAAALEAINAWALPRGYAFIQGRSKVTPGTNRIKSWPSCDRREASATSSNRRANIRGTGCQFSVILNESPDKQTWEIKHRKEAIYCTHNHAPSANPAAHPTHRRMPVQLQSLSQILYHSSIYLTRYIYISEMY